ncbi:MAG TPA: AbrB/MazE/SpoVT family DNA-binding domain-containing protein [Actinobacteria bacterium]|nr:AbrB/MazE/SpoVT family DNA-binding domain-containing protein [Actinomycetota bacterium]
MTEDTDRKKGEAGKAAAAAPCNQEPPAGPEFFGSATVGERGQIVIPADARQKLDIRPGDKLMIFSNLHGMRSLSVMKAEQVTEFVSRAMANLSRIEKMAREGEK